METNAYTEKLVSSPAFGRRVCFSADSLEAAFVLVTMKCGSFGAMGRDRETRTCCSFSHWEGEEGGDEKRKERKMTKVYNRNERVGP